MNKSNSLIVTVFYLLAINLTQAQSSLRISGIIYDHWDHWLTIPWYPDSAHGAWFIRDDGTVFYNSPGAPHVFRIFVNDLSINDTNVPTSYLLKQNYPNPFNPSTHIPLSTPEPGELYIFDILGRQINSVTLLAAGEYLVEWGGQDKFGKASASGVYLYQLRTPTQQETKKMVFLDGGGKSGLSIINKSTAVYQRLNSKKSLSTTVSGTLFVDIENYSKVIKPLTLTSDTIVNDTVNMGPFWRNDYIDMTIHVEDSDAFEINLNAAIRNDEPGTVFEFTDTTNVILISDSILTYFANGEDETIVSVNAVDPTDTTLQNTNTFNFRCCLDTTSHSFTWIIDTLGNGGWGTSDVFDIDIINENNIWAVGRYLLDDTEYDALHWNGVEWEFLQILYPHIGFDGQITSWDSRLIWNIHAFAENSIWFIPEVGSFMYWNGDSMQFHYSIQNDGFGGAYRHLWGSSENDMHFGGRTGDWAKMVHFHGDTTWTYQDSLAYARTEDIWGLDENHVWATAFDVYLPTAHENATLYFDGNEWIRKYVFDYYPILNDTISSTMTSVYAYEDTLYILCRNGLWKESISTGEGHFIYMSPYWFPVKVRGYAYNDIYILYRNGDLKHYNGFSWELIFDASEIVPEGFTITLYVTENMVVIGGTNNAGKKALIIRGLRNN